MLRKYSNSRTLADNIKLGALGAFTAGMTNIASMVFFFAYTSNVTGHYVILAEEIMKGNFSQALVVFSWIFLFFLGNFCSNQIIICFNQKYTYWAHATPVIIEILCIASVGIYTQFFYRETLLETETLIAIMLFAMGLQNGLTASISNFAVKTTHLTGITTDLGILLSMFLHRQYRQNKELRGRAQLIVSIISSYLMGALLAGFIYLHYSYAVFYIICGFLTIVIGYDLYKVYLIRYLRHSKRQAVLQHLPVVFNMKEEQMAQ